MKEYIPDHLLTRIFKHIPYQKLFTVISPVSKKWRKLATDCSPVILNFKGELPTATQISDIISTTHFSVADIHVDVTFKTNIDNIENLRGIKVGSLRIGNTAISSLKPLLSCYKSLHTLWLNNVPKMDENEIDIINKFTKLENLIISYNNKWFNDDTLAKLKLYNLKKLDISCNNVVNIECLEKFKSLKYLNLSLMNVEDISPLSSLSLITLNIEGTKVQDYSMINLDVSNDYNSNERTGLLIYRSEADAENDFRDYDRETDPYTIGISENSNGYHIHDSDRRYECSNLAYESAEQHNTIEPEKYLSLKEAASNSKERAIAAKQSTLLYKGEKKAIQPADPDLIKF